MELISAAQALFRYNKGREYAGRAWTAIYCQSGQDRKVAAIRGHCRASESTQHIPLEIE